MEGYTLQDFKDKGMSADEVKSARDAYHAESGLLLNRGELSDEKIDQFLATPSTDEQEVVAAPDEDLEMTTPTSVEAPVEVSEAPVEVSEAPVEVSEEPVDDIPFKNLIIQEQKDIKQEIQAREDADITFGQRLEATFEQENWLGSYLSTNDLQLDLELDEKYGGKDYDPYDGDIEGYEDYAEEFANSYTPSATQFIKDRIDHENENRRIIHTGGLVEQFALSAVASVLDPVQVGTAIATSGISAGVGIAGKAAILAGEVVVSEATLQSIQLTRTAEESAMNVVGSAVAGTILSAGMKNIKNIWNARNELDDLEAQTRSTEEAAENAAEETAEEAADHKAHKGKTTGTKDPVEEYWDEVIRAKTTGRKGSSEGYWDEVNKIREKNEAKIKDIEAREASRKHTEEANEIRDAKKGNEGTEDSTRLAGDTKRQRTARAVTEKGLKHMSPGMRMQNSGNLNARNIVSVTAENALIMENNYKGDLKASFFKALKTSGLKNVDYKLPKDARDYLLKEYEKYIKEAMGPIVMRRSPEDKHEIMGILMTDRGLRGNELLSAIKITPLPKERIKYHLRNEPDLDNYKMDLSKDLIDRVFSNLDNGSSPNEAVKKALADALILQGDNLKAGAENLISKFNKTFDAEFTKSHAAKIAWETLNTKTNDVASAKMHRISKTYLDKWSEVLKEQGDTRFNSIKDKVMSNKDKEFNKKAYLVRASKGDPKILEQTLNEYDFGPLVEGELKVLSEYMDEVYKKVMKVSEDSLKKHNPELWSSLSDLEGKFANTDLLYRKYNIDAINTYSDEFNEIIKNEFKTQMSTLRTNVEKMTRRQENGRRRLKELEEAVSKSEKTILDLRGNIVDAKARAMVNGAEVDESFIALQRAKIEEANTNIRIVSADIESAKSGMTYVKKILDRDSSTLSRLETGNMDSIAGDIIYNIRSKGGMLTPSDIAGIFSKGYGTNMSDVLVSPDYMFLKGVNGNSTNFINTDVHYSVNKGVEGMSFDTSMATAMEGLGPVKMWRNATPSELLTNPKRHYIVETKMITNVNEAHGYIKSDFLEKRKEFNEAKAEGEELNIEDMKAELVKSEKDMKQALADFDVISSRIGGSRGAYADPASYTARASKTLLAATTTAYLGKVAVSSLPDVGRLIIRQGLGPTFDAFRAILKSGGFQKMKTDELEAFGVGIDVAQNKRAQIMADTKSLYDEDQAYDRMLAMGTNTFMKFTGIQHWNDMLQTISSVSSIHNAITLGESLAKGNSVKKNHLAQARALGMSDDDMINIFKEWEASGKSMQGNIKLANIGEWDNKALADRFTSSVFKDVRQTVIVPGAGDKPSWYDANPLSRHISQFQGFIAGSTTRAMLSGMQTDMGRALVGGSISICLAYVAQLLKAGLDHGTDGVNEVLERDNLHAFLSALEATGAVAMMSQYSRFFAPITGLSITADYADFSASRSGTKSAAGGASLSFLERGTTASRHLFELEFSKAGKDVTRMLPFQNYYGVSYMFNRMREQ